jgi:hypothetical protein
MCYLEDLLLQEKKWQKDIFTNIYKTSLKCKCHFHMDPDPDGATQINADPDSQTLVESEGVQTGDLKCREVKTGFCSKS